MWHNGIHLAAQQLDRGLQFADGHFTTLLVQHQQALLWPAHWQRLQLACERLRISLPDQQRVHDCVLAAAADFSCAVVKVIITRGSGGRGYSPHGEYQSQWYVSATAHQPTVLAPAKLGVAELQLGCQPLLAGLKSLNRLEQVLLADEREQRGYDELVVLDQHQHVTEAVSSNIFWRVGKRWYTPQLSAAGVAGVLRQQVLQLGLLSEVALGHFKLAHLLAAEQAFLCNSVQGFRAVATLDGQALADVEIPETLSCWWQSNVSS
ncbi:aminodeoxychorismate lyase [Pseudidiomarina mangrovi]|uniref:aminodeoxychorismate lyase n=1 Tax=Pseudidiomarina mangrovi TaxID=2487133 RepID=UPI000FC9F769|nr:aminodeoxychorismate lyase [Pseudidiomarina mangrovi]